MLELTEFLDEAVWYAPDIQGNRQKPVDEQALILITPMSAADYRKCEEIATEDIVSGGPLIARYHALRARVLKKCIKEFRNIWVRKIKDSVVTRELLTVDGFTDRVGDELLEDLINAVKEQSKLEEGVLKKSSAPLDLPIAQQTRSGAGDAQDVTQAYQKIIQAGSANLTQNLDCQTSKKGTPETAKAKAIQPLL